MDKISRFVIWMCKKFNRTQLNLIVAELLTVLNDPRSEIQPKDQFKEDHPNYRNFYVDSQAPLADNSKKKKRKLLKRNTTR